MPPWSVSRSINPLMTPRVSIEFLLVKDSGYMIRMKTLTPMSHKDADIRVRIYFTHQAADNSNEREVR
jgi:hypothetical protein